MSASREVTVTWRYTYMKCGAVGVAGGFCDTQWSPCTYLSVLWFCWLCFWTHIKTISGLPKLGIWKEVCMCCWKEALKDFPRLQCFGNPWKILCPGDSSLRLTNCIVVNNFFRNSELEFQRNVSWSQRIYFDACVGQPHPFQWSLAFDGVLSYFWQEVLLLWEDSVCFCSHLWNRKINHLIYHVEMF